MHEGQRQVEIDVVRQLVRDQFPAWAQLPISALTTAGTDNAIFRMGETFTARFPLQGEDAGQVLTRLQAESAAASEFAKVSPVPAPEPVAIGAPGPGCALPWAVQTWVPGVDATAEDPSASNAFAMDLVDLLLRLRCTDTRGRCFTGAGRGGHLPDHDGWLSLCFSKSEDLVDVATLSDMWREWRTLPAVEADVMCHSDLTPPNVLVDHGRLVGLLDTGGFAAADPALDLISVWTLLDQPGRTLVRRGLRCSELQWMRGKAWALQQSMGLIWYYADSNPALSRYGLRTLHRLLDDADA